MAESYFDSLVDCTLMIGVNEFSGLRLSMFDNNHIDSQSAPNYQQHILAAISSTVAMFPFSKTNYKYPPEDFQRYEESSIDTSSKPQYTKQFSHEEFHLIHDIINQYNKTDIHDQLKDPGISVGFNRRASKYQSRRKSMKLLSLDNYKGSLGSVSIETIKAFPGTYFNNNLKISDKHVGPKIEILPMTDNLGNRSYAFRLEFHRHFSTESNTFTGNDSDNEIKIVPAFETDLDSRGDIYLPCNIVFFSKYPYLNLFKDILSQLFLSIDNKGTTQIDEEILEYSSILTRIPIMHSSDIQIDFSIDRTLYSIKPNSVIFEQIIDWDMSLLFQSLSLDDIIFILIAMFQDQKIAFFSKFLNITTIICETLMILYQPFIWKHLYLTVVPPHLYVLIDAIIPFLIGLPHNMKEKVINSYDDIIVVDLDQGTINKPKKCKIYNISDNLIAQLKQGLTDRDWLHFRNHLSNVGYNSLNDLKANEYRINKAFSEKVMLHFMMMMVDLFQEPLKNIVVEIKNDTLVANLDRFLASSHSENIDFFKAIYQCDNFNCFLDSKLRKMETDSWVKICDNLYPDFLEHLRFQVSKIKKGKKLSIHFERDININLVEESLYSVINLRTSKHYRKDYYKNILEHISKLDKTIEIRKLEIEIYLQSGSQKKALESIEQLLVIDKDALDTLKIQEIIRALEKIVKKDPENVKLINSLTSLLKIDNHVEKKRSSVNHSVQQFIPPNIPIMKKDFLEICRNADITDFEDVAYNLFKCLTLNQNSPKNHVRRVPPNLFQCFYNGWILFSTNFNVSDISINALPEEELIIVSNNSIKVDDFGQGRILLSQMRLLFIPFGKTVSEVVVDFTNEIVKKIKIDRRIRGFGKLAEVIEITKSSHAKKIVLWLSPNIEVWYNLISEVNIGNRLSNEEKDKVIQDKMTDHCLMYENLVNCSRKNSYFKKYFDDISKIMLGHTLRNMDMGKNGDPGTIARRKYLLNKLMPCPKNTITIDCAALIYKPLLQNSDLWCAITYDDKYFIKIIKIISETFQFLQPDDLEFMSRIKVMFHLKGSTKMVIGCFNGSIFLVDSLDLKVEEFNIHENQVSFPQCGVSRVSSFNSYVIYLGMNNEELWKCEDNFQQSRKILSNTGGIYLIELHDENTLIMSSSHSIYIATDEGTILSVIDMPDMKINLNRISYLAVSNINQNILIGLSRFPMFIEYDISDKKNPVFVKHKIYMPENASKSVGLSTILTTKNDTDIWLIYKDGTIDIRHGENLEKVDSLSAHDGVVGGGLICQLAKMNIVITFGKNDGKVIFWNLKPI